MLDRRGLRVMFVDAAMDAGAQTRARRRHLSPAAKAARAHAHDTPADAELDGRYVLRRRPELAARSGTFTKSGSKVKFSSGPLKGKRATFTAAGGAVTLPVYPRPS